MNGVGTPRQKEVIYQRRRLAALAIVLLVVALIIWAVVALRGGSEEDPATTGTSTEITGAAAETTRETTTAETTAASGTETTTPGSPAPDAKKTCELADLIVSAATDRPNYAEGERPQLFMTVANPTAADCEIDLDEEVLRFEVYNLANNARVWSDVDCNPAVETGTRVFPAGEQRYFQATWSGTTSAPQQCDDRQAVPAGSYFLHTVIGGNPSPAQTFNLR